VRIDSIELAGFGRLHQIQIDFGPGLNVVYGPNEVGKSTLFEAIAALLFGFSDSASQATQQLNKNKAPFSPWDGGAFEGAIVVSLTNSDHFRIERDFARDKARVYQMPGASECTSEFAEGRRGFLTFAERYLGFGRPVFHASAVIDQAELSLDNNGVSAIKAKLERLADSAGTEASAREALDRLDRWLRDRVNPGGFSARTSQYKKAAEDIDRLTTEREKSYGVFRSLEIAAVEERRLTEEIAGLERTFHQLTIQIDWDELVELKGRIERVDTIDSDLKKCQGVLDAHREVADDPASVYDAAFSWLAQVDQREADVYSARTVVDVERVAMEKTTSALAEINARLAALPTVADDDLSRAEAAVRAWEAAHTAEERAADQLQARDGQLKALRSSASPRIAAITTATTADALGIAIREVASCAERLAEATAAATNTPFSDSDDAEFTRLETSTKDLNDERIEQCAAWESQLASGRSAAAPSTPRPAIPAVVGVLVGLIVGWLAGGPVGAVLGAIVLGAVGYVVGGRLAPASQPTPDSRLAQTQLLLNQELDRYGASSVVELRRRWNRYLVLQAAVPAARERQRVRTEWLARHQRALDNMFLVGGTRDVDAARVAETDLRDREQAIIRGTTQLGDAEVTRDAAQIALGTSRAAAERALAVVDLTATTPDLGFESLRAIGETRLERQKLLGDRAEQQHQADAGEAHVRALGETVQKLIEARAIAMESLARVGVPTLDEHSVECLRVRHEAFGAYTDALSHQSQLMNTRRFVIGSDDPAEWARRRDLLQTRVATADEDDPRGVDELNRLRNEASAARQVAADQQSQVRANRDSVLRGVRPPAEIEEELATAQQERDRLERLKNALEGANSLLNEVALSFHRGFAPQLESGMRGILSTVTGGRYLDVAIDPEDLGIKLKLVGRLELVRFDQVSHGTRDAVALLLRTSIVDLLSSSNEPVPIFLDDPLVHIDRQRATVLLDVLGSLAEHRQLFYFTQDERVIAWAQDRPTCCVHSLERITPGSMGSG
jgi:energy-coupling factor transporter ATP-binding protein EcfA2/uncharacterized membrane protein YeaQ/YmgE (transglycosylase-associated protein family)